MTVEDKNNFASRAFAGNNFANSATDINLPEPFQANGKLSFTSVLWPVEGIGYRLLHSLTEFTVDSYCSCFIHAFDHLTIDSSKFWLTMEINPRDQKFRIVFESSPVLSRSELLCFDRFLANASFASCMYILHRCAFLAKQVHNQTVTRQNHKPKLPRLAVKHNVKLYIHWNSAEGLLKIGEFSLLEPIWSLACGWLLIFKDKFRLS